METAPTDAPTLTLADVDLASYDFLDLGCSSGGSVAHAATRFGAKRGLGIDLDPRKVAAARAADIDVVQADATRLNVADGVRFITMMDFLEHLPGLDTVERVLASAAEAATDFLYIKHPSFEGKERAEALGVRQYWWHWTGHTTHIRVDDYCTILDRLGLRQYMIRYLGRVDRATHPTVIPIDLAPNQGVHAAREYRDKPDFALDPPLWRRQDIFVALRPFESAEWAEITAPTPGDVKRWGAS